MLYERHKKFLFVSFFLPSQLGVLGEYPNKRLGFVHIEDVVAAHILVMEEQKASGRYICSNSVQHMSQIIDMLRTKYPSYPFENK